MATSGTGNYLIGKIANNVFNNTGYTPPTSVDVALFTVAMSDGTGGTGTECTGTNYPSYARVQVAYSANWTISATQVKNANTISFPTPTGSPTAVVVGFAIYEHGNNNLLYFGQTSSSQTINAGAAVTFAANALVINLS